MPPAKSKPAGRPAAKTAAKPTAKAKPATKPAAKPAAKTAAPTMGGIPLKSKTVWVLDTESAQFKAARRRDAEALKAGDADGMQLVEGLLVDKDVMKWWT